MPRDASSIQLKPLFPFQKDVVERLGNTLKLSQNCLLVCQPGWGKTLTFGWSFLNLPKPADGGGNIAVVIAGSASILTQHKGELHFSPHYRTGLTVKQVRDKGAKLLPASHHILGMTQRSWNSHVSPNNLEALINAFVEVCRGGGRLVLAFDEVQTLYGRSRSKFLQRWAAVRDRLKEALAHVAAELLVVGITATPETGEEGDQVRTQHDLIMGEAPTVIEPSNADLAQFAESRSHLPTVAARKTVRLPTSNAHHDQHQHLCKLVLGGLLFSSAARPPLPQQGVVEGRRVTVKSDVPEEECDGDAPQQVVRFHDSDEKRSVPRQKVTLLRVMTAQHNRAVRNCVASICAVEVFENKKGIRSILQSASIHANKAGQTVPVNDSALVFFNNKFAARNLANNLGQKREDEDGNLQNSPFKVFVLDADPDENDHKIVAAIEAIEAADDTSKVVVFAAECHRRATNAFNTFAPRNFVVIGFEAPSDLVQIEGRLGRFSEEGIQMPFVLDKPISNVYFSSEMMRKAAVLPKPTMRRDLLLSLPKTELVIMTGEDATDKTRTQLVDIIIENETAAKRKRKRKSLGAPFEEIDVQLRAHAEAAQQLAETTEKVAAEAEMAALESAGDASAQKASETAAEEHAAAKKLVSLLWERIYANEHHASFLDKHPLVNFKQVSGLYDACTKDRAARNNFQEEYYHLVKSYLRPEEEDEDEEEEEVDVAVLRAAAATESSMQELAES